MDRARLRVDGDPNGGRCDRKCNVSGKAPSARSAFFPAAVPSVGALSVPIAMHAVMLPTAAALGTLYWQDWLTKAADGLYHSPADRGWGALTTSDLVLRIALNAIVGGNRSFGASAF
jgi:hypothetical protein